MATGSVESSLELAGKWQRPSDPNLADEYERLFVGPGRVPCPPYESLWRDDTPARLQGTLLGPCVPDLQNCYAALGMRVTPASGELPDHIGVELEALAVALSDAGYAPVARALLTDHLARWVPAFCRAVIDNTKSDYYRTLAGATTVAVLKLERLSRAPGG